MSRAAAEPQTPAARRMKLWVARARAGGALVGFLLGMWVCDRQGIPLVDATLRSLLAAAALAMVSWWCALLVIQALIRTAAVQRRAEIEAATAEAAAAHAERWAAEDEDVQRRLRRRRGEPEPGDDADHDAAAEEGTL